MAARVDRLTHHVETYNESARQPQHEYRERIRALVESQWSEQVVVISLGDVKPEFDVPGRRRDGTVKGRRLVRRFFWNIFRGVVNSVASVFFFVGGGGLVDVFERSGRVTGPRNAQALGVVDAARRARGLWLVHSSSRIAVLDSGTNIYTTETPLPKFLWHAAKPHAPQFSPTDRRLTWPDGSVFEYHVSDQELKVSDQDNGG